MEPNHLTATTAAPQEVVAKIDQKALRLSALLREIDNHPIELETVLRDQLDDVLESAGLPDRGDQDPPASIQPRVDGGRISRITGVAWRLGTATAVEATAAVLITLAAIVARFWALSTQPGGLFPDEAAEGISAQNLLAIPGYHPVFFNSDGGREALYAYIVAAVFRVLGSSVLTLRGTAAGVGVLGVIATYLAIRRFGRGPALIAMLWAAGSLWMIAVSRDGFRNILTVVVGAAALGVLLRWGDRTTRGTAIAAGAVCALGFWTYQPLKLLPVLAIVWVLSMRARDRERFARLRPTLTWAGVAFVVVAAPMIYTAITDASGYFGRAAAVSVFNADSGSAESFPVHALRTVGMFLVTGDPNERHDVSALPLLGPLLFVLFGLGIWRCWRHRADHAHVLVLLGLVVFLIPPLLATEGFAPHFLRSLGLEPYVAACVGLALRRGGADRTASGLALRRPEPLDGDGRRMDRLRRRGRGRGSRVGGDICEPADWISLCPIHVRRCRARECCRRQRHRRWPVDAAHSRRLRRDGRAVPRRRPAAHHRRGDATGRQSRRLFADRRPVASRHRGCGGLGPRDRRAGGRERPLRQSGCVRGDPPARCLPKRLNLSHHRDRDADLSWEPTCAGTQEGSG